MSEYHALMWKVKPESAEAVAQLFRTYGRPDPIVRDPDGNVIARLLSTQIFMKDNVVVRVIEIEGDFMAVSAHLGRQPPIVELEKQLDPYLETPRDMSTREGAQKFFRESAMRLIKVRTIDDPD